MTALKAKSASGGIVARFVITDENGADMFDVQVFRLNTSPVATTREQTQTIADLLAAAFNNAKVHL
jgi:hypothetical protein